LPAGLLLLLFALLIGGCGAATSTRGDGNGGTLSYSAVATSADPRFAAIVVDVSNDRVLYADHADAIRHPASLAKMMTLYILFEELDAGRLSLTTPLPVSRAAAAQPPSKIGVKAGSTILVRDAINVIAVRSANDVAVVVAEAIAGSEENFARRMNATARALGMPRTVFRNATGLPDPAMVTTAREMATLARALQTRFPGRYRVFSQETLSYGGRTWRSTNDLLGDVPGMDGIKTGYIRASGYNLATSVKRGDKRLIIVVMGGRTPSDRAAHVLALVDEYLPERRFHLLALR
jgi:D-alanyl-D-alanine carboxypeptidase